MGYLRLASLDTPRCRIGPTPLDTAPPAPTRDRRDERDGLGPEKCVSFCLIVSRSARDFGAPARHRCKEMRRTHLGLSHRVSIARVFVVVEGFAGSP